MSAPKKSAWDSYRQYSNILKVTLPIVLCLIVLGEFVPKAIEAAFLFLFPVIILAVLASIPIKWFECPRCRERFFIPPGFFSFYRPGAKQCLHCGLPKWDEGGSPIKPAKVELYPIPSGNNFRPDPVTVERLRLANFLTLVLRDDPGAIGLRLDPEGWTDADHLVARANRYDVKLTRESLGDIASDSKNDHFDWDPAGNRVRWRKG
jgi:hypothetical protein